MAVKKKRKTRQKKKVRKATKQQRQGAGSQADQNTRQKRRKAERIGATTVSAKFQRINHEIRIREGSCLALSI